MKSPSICILKRMKRCVDNNCSSAWRPSQTLYYTNWRKSLVFAILYYTQVTIKNHVVSYLSCFCFIFSFTIFIDCKHVQNSTCMFFLKEICPRISTQHNTDDVRILSPFLLTFSKKIEGNSGKALCLIMNVSFRSTAITREKCDSSIHYLYTSHTRGLLDCISMWP